VGNLPIGFCPACGRPGLGLLCGPVRILGSTVEISKFLCPEPGCRFELAVAPKLCYAHPAAAEAAPADEGSWLTRPAMF
jgi:hypothetical protein